MNDTISELEIFDFILHSDLSSFVHQVFQTVSPGDAYIPNWHIDAVTHELTRIYRGDNLRLIVTQPPRSLKSICASVAFVAWALGHDPRLRFACVSYSSELAGQFARQFRTVVTSSWYQSLFPNMRLQRDTETECLTTKGGGRIAVSVGGTFTGRGADIIIIDDPMKAEDAQSEKVRTTVNEWFGSTLVSRLNDKARGRIIVVMQRLHQDDLVGHLLQQEGWRHLNLPAIAEFEQKVATGPNAFHIRKEGDVLHPARESKEVLDRIRGDMGSFIFSAQYQQRPVPLEGNLIKREWLKSYERLPSRKPGHQVVQSWDVATSVGLQNDWSVCTTWLIDRNIYYLIDVWRGRLAFPDVKRKLIELARTHSANTILVEQDGLGKSLVQIIRDEHPQRVCVPIPVKAVGDKVDRLTGQSARFEAGQIVLPQAAPWLGDFVNELLAFPNLKYDDQVDSVSQFLIWVGKCVYRQAVGLGGKLFVDDRWNG